MYKLKNLNSFDMNRLVFSLWLLASRVIQHWQLGRSSTSLRDRSTTGRSTPTSVSTPPFSPAAEPGGPENGFQCKGFSIQYSIVIKIQFDKGHSLRLNMASLEPRNTLTLFWVNLSKLLCSFVRGRYLRFVNWQLSALRLTDPSTLLTVGSWSERTQTSAFAGTCKLTWC